MNAELFRELTNIMVQVTLLVSQVYQLGKKYPVVGGLTSACESSLKEAHEYLVQARDLVEDEEV